MESYDDHIGIIVIFVADNSLWILQSSLFAAIIPNFLSGLKPSVWNLFKQIRTTKVSSKLISFFVYSKNKFT